MIEDLRNEYYWGDVDKKSYLFDDNDFSKSIYALWNAKCNDDVDRVFGNTFYGYDEMFRLIKSIITEYVNNYGNLKLIEQYKTDFQSIDVMDTEWFHWDMLRRVFSGINAQYFAYMCRTIEERILLENRLRKHSLVLRKYSLYASRGNWDKANQIIMQLRESNLKEEWYERYSQLLDFHDTLQRNVFVNDQYGHFVEDKKIVLVGVAPHESNDDLNDEDTIYAFINYFGKEKLLDIDKMLPIDVSYYNYASSLKAISEKAKLKELKYMVCKDLNYDFKQYSKDDKLRNSHSLMFGCPFGHPLMIPVIIFDLAHYKNRAIHITHTNFYCSDKSYYDGYWEMDAVKELLIGLSSHDLIGNWILTKTWYKQGLFTCDDEMSAVLGMSEEEYTMQLEKSFGVQLKGR